MNKKSFFSESSDLFLFREKTLMAVAAIVSLLLQIISFFTTLDGAKAYFAATFAYAPLLFALAVQSVVYFLENGLRRRVTFLKLLALVMAICCSSYFSFVGIYNNINPPSQYLRQTYNSYSKELSAMREDYLSQGNEQYTSAVNEGVNYIIGQYTVLNSEKATLEALSEEIASAESSTVNGMYAPRRDDFETYEEYAAAYAAYISGYSQGSTAEQQAKLQAILNKYGISDPSEITLRTAEITAQLSLIEGSLASCGGGEVQMRAEVLRARALRGEEKCCSDLMALYKSISGETLVIPDFISDKSLQLTLPEYEEIAGADAPAVVRERLLNTVTTACDELNAAGIEVDPAAYGFENIYTLPIAAVLSGEYGADAVISLILAVLVDTLSLLFAMIFVRSKSALAAKDTRQAISCDDMLFQRNIVTAVRLGMCRDGEAFSCTPDMDEIADRLGAYAASFRAVDFAADNGYTLAAERSQLVDFEALTAFLCQFGLARILTAEEMTLLCGSESQETVLLKTKFILWLSEKSDISEVKQHSAKAVTA